MRAGPNKLSNLGALAFLLCIEYAKIPQDMGCLNEIQTK